VLGKGGRMVDNNPRRVNGAVEVQRNAVMVLATVLIILGEEKSNCLFDPSLWSLIFLVSHESQHSQLSR